MSLIEKLAENRKEITGSRTKNRLSVQISYAIQLIIDYFSLDYIVLMDYIEDVAIIDNPDNPSSIHMYQLKTKSSDKQYTLSTVISDKWFQKLYDNAVKYGGYVNDAVLVCNTDIVHNQLNVFKNEKNKLSDLVKDNNIRKIRKAISKDQGIPEDQVDLSKFYFIRSNLSTKGHKEEVEYQFENFLVNKEPDLQIATARALYRLLYNELDRKFNCEIDDSCTDINEIFDKKGIKSKDIENIVTSSLAVQLPSTETLFEKFGITNLKDILEYNNRYSQIKMDMFSDQGLLSDTRKRIQQLIVKEINAGATDFPTTLDIVYDSCLCEKFIPTAYNEIYYLKLMIMIMIYKYIFGNGSVSN